MANAKWCVYMGLFALAPNMPFCLHFSARLPGVCCARIYARRLVLCVVQTANCPMIQESIWEAASKEGRGRISQGGSKGKPDSPPFKNLPKAFSKCFWLFFEGLARFEWTIWKPFKSPYPSYTPKTMRNISKALRHRIGQMRNCLVMREALSRAWNRPRADMHGYGRV